MILHELLTGKPPFDAFQQLRSAAPPTPPALAPGVPAALAGVCQRCLRGDPAERYATAADLADDLIESFADAAEVLQDLGAWFGGETIIRGGPTAPQRGDEPLEEPRRFWPHLTRRRVLLLVGTVALAGVVLGLALWGRRPTVAPPDTPQRGPTAAPFPPVELTGWIDVVMSRPGDPRRQLLRLSSPAALPLKAGDEVRVEASVSRPAFLYVLWVDTRGTVLPVYPWERGDWARRGPERSNRELNLPEGGGIWPLAAGPAGVETLVLLARDTPLPPEFDVRAALGELGPQTVPDAAAATAIWLLNGAVVRDEANRAPDFGKVQESSHPAVRTAMRVQERLGGPGVLTRAVSFGNTGR